VIPIIWPVALAIGRWWVIALIAIAWPLLLLINGTLGWGSVPAAAGLAAANAAPFALIGWSVRRLGRTFAKRLTGAS
jgi:hypothetical protein